MTRIQAGEVMLDYEIHGSGEPMLLVQGLGYAKWGWSWNVDALSKRFQVITFDNRGVGSSDAPEGPYTAKQMASDAAALLDAFGVKSAHVVGASLGGFISLELAIARPDLVKTLVLACTLLGLSNYVPMPEVTVKMLMEFPNLTQEERIRRGTYNAFSNAFQAEHPEVIDKLIEYRKQTAQGFEQWSWQNNAGATFDAGDRIDQIACPTLVVTGVEDNVVDPRNAEILAKAIANATLVQMPGGHVFFIEQSERFNALVTAFCSGEANGGGGF
ncbi:MAG: alpha/beta fold hydrolase [Actinomycetota bacterium]